MASTEVSVSCENEAENKQIPQSLDLFEVSTQPSWNLMQMQAEIEEANKKFLEALPDTGADPWKTL